MDDSSTLTQHLTQRLDAARTKHDAVLAELRVSRIESRRTRSVYLASAYIIQQYIDDAQDRLEAAKQFLKGADPE